MKQKHKVILRVIFITAVPVILNYLSKSDNCLDYFQRKGIIGQNVNLLLLKDLLLAAGMVFSVIFLSIRLASVEINEKTVAKERKSLIKYNKEIFLNALKSKNLISSTSMNIRIFVPGKGKALLLKRIIEKLSGGLIRFRKQFTIRNVEELADSEIAGSLTFEVYPQAQGVVGNCFKQRTIVYDENFKKTSHMYSLTEYQMNRMRDLEFCLCSPVFNEKGDIISIISFESTQKINISRVNKAVWIDMITNYCQFLNDYLPELFR